MGAIEPILLHGCAIWSTEVSKKCICKFLIRVQRLAGQIITRCNKKAHYLDIMSLAGLMPIAIRAKELSLRWWAGVCTNADNPSEKTFNKLNVHKKK